MRNFGTIFAEELRPYGASACPVGAPSGRFAVITFQRVTALPVFDFAAFFAAFDARRRDRRLSWYEFADELWQQSSELNSHRSDHPL